VTSVLRHRLIRAAARTPRGALLLSTVAVALLLEACRGSSTDARAEAPPPLVVQQVTDRALFEVEQPARFALAEAVPHTATSELRVTGTVTPDVSKSVPVISLASGRVVEVRARIGDVVTKGQVLMRVQSADVSSAYADYQQARADEALAGKQLDRSKDLFGRGAIAQKDLEIAQATEDKARVTVTTTAEHLSVLGVDPANPSPIVEIPAPVSGVITDQQVTIASGVQALGTPSPFTISDLTDVWIVCDVFENDLATVRLGEHADIRLTAYPERTFAGVISNIGPILDPTLRTAKVRIQVDNPGLMRLGMFVTATFHGRTETRAAVPAKAILHLHDRDWVFVPVQGPQFRRLEVVGGDMLAGGMQEIISGLTAGQRVVSNALEFQNTVQR
jgi:cobalt-zinc-cadmium efflux system membrane fusion protein